jgi:16S rRNA (guanine966-N2)-methyltransferase
MRVIAGKYKKRKLTTLDGIEITRPTSDRIKENIFNILQENLLDKHVLDLFAGSGALGIEALSRGAKKVCFVENNRGAIECIKTNIDNIKIEKNFYHLSQHEVSEALNPLKGLLQEKFDLIFADPPYTSQWHLTALTEIENSGLCNDACLVIFEMPILNEISKESNQTNWERIDLRNYGKTKIEIWSYKDEKN